ncbi:serine hydrolase domain-containing protein [Oceanobacillus profundus]|uniref:serine hydrolase domain-containing protein n=1 Tax=Oceanobacillus TaxID=182709 RepID=UPI0026E46157|nr:serine hydrolase domain-containing protein [Oceanobacillus profundus]MDO6447968.1 serine hydrolase domain-containing protein [Oceanobacillus profundus]
MKKRLLTVTTIIMTIILLFPHAGGISNASIAESIVVEADRVQMLQQPLDDLDDEIEEALADRVMPGAVVLIARDGEIVKHQAYGYAARYTDDQFTEMDEPVSMQEDTIFDVASISKLFTATAIMQLWDQGAFELDDPVYWYIPEFAAQGKEDVTIRHLLTHTSGFRPSTTEPIHEMEGTREELLDFVLNEPLQNPPGTAYVYSDVDYITLGVLIERVSGERQDDFVREFITEPLNMSDTMYDPSADLQHRIAATEYQPWTNRGIVWGSVHDEKAWALDGVAGHAGVFSSASDLAVFAEMMLNKGNYEGTQILTEEAFEQINTNWNEAFPGQDQGIGWELNQEWYMDDLAEFNTMGHTGYTGTSIVVSPNKESVTILLTNRVHPTRNTVSTNTIRRKAAEKTADSIHAWNAAGMRMMVERLDTRGAFELGSDARALQLHLTAIEQYENKGDQAKVVKHLEGFQQLVDYLFIQEGIDDATHDDLQRTTDYLIEKWQ